MIRYIAVKTFIAAMALTGVLVFDAVAQDAPCGGDFDRWMKQLRRDATAQGVSGNVISYGLSGLTPNSKVLAQDRRQSVFTQSFLKFAGRMVSENRMKRGRQLLKRHSSIFKQVKKEYGVPAPVIAAFWGLETDFGGYMGNFNTMRSLVTLAYDCRRPELFRPHVIDALKLLQRGDISLTDMKGAWAGELGQTQFLPTDYLEIGVDFDRDGRVDLLRSVPDVLASTANLIRKFGWRAGEPWLQEVRVPGRMAWDQADISINHSRAKWDEWGVRLASGDRLPIDETKAALLLPMGRNGPAFLAYDNFIKVYLEWNRSLVYSTTAAYFATRLAGAPAMRPGNGEVVPLSQDQMKELQSRLAQRGFDVGKIDGILGAGTRAAVKNMQIKYGYPADSYPTVSLLRRLR